SAARSSCGARPEPPAPCRRTWIPPISRREAVLIGPILLSTINGDAAHGGRRPGELAAQRGDAEAVLAPPGPAQRPVPGPAPRRGREAGLPGIARPGRVEDDGR